MKIIKKDGRLEEFNGSKIVTSINNAASESDIILNNSDIKIIVKDIEDKLFSLRGEESPTSSYEVTGMIITVLRDDKFVNVLNSFIGFNK